MVAQAPAARHDRLPLGNEEAARRALMELPGIGDRLSLTLSELLLTGHMPVIEGLGERPEDVLGSIAGVGPELARRIHDALHVESLADLERAAHDGRLATVP